MTLTIARTIKALQGLHPSAFLAAAVAAWLLAASPAALAADPADVVRQEKELRAALSANPNDAAAHLKLGQLYVDQAKYAAAEAEARAARRPGPLADDADALLAWTLFLQSQKNIFTQIKPGQREPRAEAIVRMSLGLAYLAPGELSSAEPLLRDAVRLDPKSWRARIALARLLILLRNLPEAREQLDAAGALAPGEAGLIRITAELKRAEGDTDGAIADFGKAIALNPTSLPSITGRADAFISQDKLAEARQDVIAAAKLLRNPQVTFLDSLILARQGKMAEADQQLARATPSFDRVRIGYYLSGVVKFWLGLPETADANLARFQGRQPNVPAVPRLRAEIALARKDAAGAIRLLKPVVEANPWDQAAVSVLARAYLERGETDRVIQLFEQVAAAPRPEKVPQPDLGGLIMMYGNASGDLAQIEKIILRKAPATALPLIELREGNIDKAAAMAEPLAAAAPDDTAIQSLLGSVRLAQKRLPEAEAIFRRVLDEKTLSTTAALNLVRVLVAQKRIGEANTMLDGLAQRPSNDD